MRATAARDALRERNVRLLVGSGAVDAFGNGTNVAMVSVVPDRQLAAGKTDDKRLRIAPHDLPRLVLGIRVAPKQRSVIEA